VSFPRYPEYKDSGIEWLGELPSAWGLARLKAAAHVIPSNVDKHSKSEEQPTKLCNYTDVYYNDLITSNVNFMGATASAGEIAKFALAPGDVVITKDSETADDIAVPAFVAEPVPGVICGYHLALVRAREGTYGRYLHYLFHARYLRSYFEVQARGLTRVGISQSALGNAPIPMPQFAEQKTIADFLDRETAKIDALIEEQQRLIELLEEKRQAVISHAVTKGLDPDAPMKDSGVEWLGEVPAHWGIRKLSTVTEKITNGYVGPTRGLFVGRGVPYLQSLHIKNNQISFSPEYFVPKRWSDKHNKSILKPGDVLIVQTGDIGQVAVVPEGFFEANCHALIIASPIKSVLSGTWLSWVLNSNYGFNSLLSIKTGALHPHLNCGYVKDLQIPVPPKNEQIEISKFIQHNISRLAALLFETEKLTERLRERRSALISAAVTGKIDVRNWQPRADFAEDFPMTAEQPGAYEVSEP